GAPASAARPPRATGAAPGKACLVCETPIAPGDPVIIHRGRRIHLHEGVCLEEWEENPGTYFREMQPRGALVQESAEAWFYLGLYVLSGLLFGAACACAAVNRGRPPFPWLVAGLLGNVVALAVLLSRPRGEPPETPAGIPCGRAKVPATRAPARCPERFGDRAAAPARGAPRRARQGAGDPRPGALPLLREDQPARGAALQRLWGGVAPGREIGESGGMSG
ncbi:MAG: hypothetical protein ACE5GW_06735, partial [Planctomycetota bacterium]